MKTQVFATGLSAPEGPVALQDGSWLVVEGGAERGCVTNISADGETKRVIKKTGRPMTLWQGTCIVHEQFSEREMLRLKAQYPDALVAAHPECPEGILKYADHVGSTRSILQFATTAAGKRFLIATEEGIIHQMRKLAPDREYIALPPDNGCRCNECPFMKLNTIEKLYLCLRDERPEIVLPEELNAYDVLVNDWLVFSQATLDAFLNRGGAQ